MVIAWGPRAPYGLGVDAQQGCLLIKIEQSLHYGIVIDREGDCGTLWMIVVMRDHQLVFFCAKPVRS